MTTLEAPPERACIEVGLEGAALLTNPLLNKGTAFTDDEPVYQPYHRKAS